MKRQAPDHLELHRFPIEPWRFVEREYDVARPRADRDAVRRRQRLHRHAGQPGGGPRRPQPRHVPQRVPRDVAHPPRRGGVRVRQDRPDDRQRARRQADEAVRRRRAAAARRRRPRGLRAGARLPRRHADARPRVAHAGRQAGAGALAAARQPGPPPPRDADVRGHAARRVGARSSCRRSSSTARTARTSTTSPPTPSARRPTRARCARSTTGCSMPRLHREHDGEVVLGYRCANSGMTMACAYRHLIDTPAPAHASRPTVGPDLAKTVIAGPHAGRPDAAHRQARRRTTRRPACRPRSSPTAATARSTGPSTTGRTLILAEQREWLDRFWEDSDVELRGDDAGQQARALEPVPARPGERPDPGARHRRQGRHRRRLRGPLLLGHRDVRRAVPRLHQPGAGPQGAALPLAAAAARPAQRAAELNQVGALYPWRTINGEEASAYYAAGTAQYHINAAIAFALKRYLDASGDVDVPRRRGGRDPRRDGPAVGGPRLLRRQRRGGVPDPRRHRTRRVHDRRQRQPVHERDGPLQHALRGAGRRAARRSGTATPTPACAGASACSRTRRSAGRGPPSAMYLPVRRGARHPPAGRQRSSSSSRGTSTARRPRSTRCCCTTTRS